MYSSESLWLIVAKTSDITYCTMESVNGMRAPDRYIYVLLPPHWQGSVTAPCVM